MTVIVDGEGLLVLSPLLISPMGETTMSITMKPIGENEGWSFEGSSSQGKKAASRLCGPKGTVVECQGITEWPHA